jgi:hypothetical protein
MTEELEELKHIADLLQVNNGLLQANNELLRRHSELLAPLLKVKHLMSPAMEERLKTGV